MPLTPEERARRRESRRSDREKERKTGANSLRNNLQGYQTESARLFGLSVLSSNDSSNISSSILRNSSNESSNNLDSSFNSAAKQGRRIIHRNLSGIEEGLDSSAAEDIKSGSLHSMHMQPPGQDAAQGASPRHNRAGPFDKDNSEDDDNYYDEEEGETNNNGNPFLDDSVDDRASSPEEREFQPAKLDRSGRSGKSNKSGRTSEGGPGGSFDADDDAPSKARPANLVASALTTSSAATQKVANTDVDGSNRKTARDRFMDVMPDDEEDRGETVEDYGSPFNNTGPSPFDDDSVDDQASQGSYEQPRAYRPFSGGSQSSVATGDVSGEHYASMQELLEEERSRSIVGHKTSRCGGCVEKVLGGKRTKRRKITLLVIIVLLCVMIGVSVWSIVLGPKGTRGSGDGKGGGVETQNNLNKPIERPATSFTPAKSENSSSSADSTFGMDNNSTDDLLGFELTFPLEGVTTDATSDSTSPTSSPVAAPTLVSPEMIIPAEIETTPTPSGSPTPPISEFNLPEPVSATSPPTEFPTAAEMTVEPTESPTAAETTLQPTDAPLAAPFVSPTSDPTTAAPVSNPTNPPITTSVPSVQTDISGLLTFSEPVPQDTEADLIIFLDALKKSIRSAVSSSLQPSDELVYVEIISINGEPVESLLSRRRFIRRRLQFGTLIEYELVVLSDCDSPDCANADTIASDVVSRTTDEMSSSVDSGAFASTLEVNVLSSSGGSVEFLSGVELGYFSEPKVTVLTPTLDYGANETSSINSTSPVDIIAANETEPIDSSTADNNTATFDTCNFCEDGMPDPLKVVSTNGLTCNQLKEAVSEEDSESSTCMTVQQAEVLCCATSATASDTSSETFSMNETMVSDEADVDIGEGNATFTGNETIVTNSTNGELDDINITDTSSMNTTEWGNETFSTNITSAHYLSEHNETMASNFTYDFNIIMDTVGNETFVSYGDGQITDKNGTDSEFDLIDRNETMATNSTSEDFDFDIIDTTDGNETSLSFDAMPIIYDNGTDSGFVNDALWPDLVCPDTLSRSIEVDVYASLFYEVVRPSSLEARNGILCARLEVKSLGWVGFALSRDGAMIGSEAIIALPSDNTVLKYSLLGKSSDLISKVDDDHQTLRDTSVTQDLELGITTMEFVKHLEEFEEIPILTSGPNYFLYARGWSNVLGYHQGRMSFMKDFAEDVVVVVDDDVSVDPSDSNETVVTNFTSDGSDFNIGTVVVGNETFVTFEDMSAIFTNGTDSGFGNDALYPDDNSTLDDKDGNQTFNNVVTASDDTSDPGVLNSTLDDSNGSLVDVIDVPDPSAILDALSLPYTLSHELGGISAAAHFGFSVAMSSNGNIVAVGAKNMAEPVLGEEVGAVHLYSMETSPPTLLQTVFNEYPKGEFGNSIGLSNDGSRLVVGARSENDQAGVVRVYGRDSFGQWAMLGMPINGFSSGERAGWSVSISSDGSSVAVGAPKGGGSASGSVVTYRFENGSSWEPYGNVLEGMSKEAFGYTIALSYDGRLVAVGSPKSMNPEGASNTGKVSVFYMYGTEWLPLPASEIHGISENDIDGTSVALSQDGSILVVGGKGRDNDGGVSNVGHCRIYKFGTEWELLHSMEGQTENERLGSSVAVAKNGNVVACGGEGAMYDGVGIGVVRIWNRETSQSSTVWPRTSDGGALFGSALALKEDGKVLAVGAPERISMTAGSKAGAVDVYEDFII